MGLAGNSYTRATSLFRDVTESRGGYEFQDAAYVDSGILIQLKLVKGGEEDDRLESKKLMQHNGDARIMGRMLS